MPQMDTKIWKIDEDDKVSRIELYRKYEYGLRDAMAALIFLIAASLITAIILIFTSSFPYVLISFLLFIIMVICLVILAFKIVAHSEIHTIIITGAEVNITKKSIVKFETKNLPRELITHLKMPGADYSVEGVLVDYMTFPVSFFSPGLIGDNLSPAFYMGNAPTHFFEFGTKAQKMWIMKYIHKKIFK